MDKTEFRKNVIWTIKALFKLLYLALNIQHSDFFFQGRIGDYGAKGERGDPGPRGPPGTAG
jgi:hypothetical protein